jgi:segregation and condensation protein A
MTTHDSRATDETNNYQVNLPAFQGPLDLLLFLIKKKKIDIHDIPIASITSEYLNYLDRMESINLEREAEFLLMASLLIYIKSQMLLPREKISEDVSDPRQVLVDRLMDYRRIKAACSLLKEKEDEQTRLWLRTSIPSTVEEEEIVLEEVSLFDLAEAFFTLMKKREKENIQIIKGKEYSLEAKMKEMIAALEEHISIDFLDYFSSQESLEEALVSFFCLLELIKAGIVIAVQDHLFRSIKVKLRKRIH